MGRGDKRTRKGKINRASYGKTRRPGNRKKKERLVPLPPQPVAAAQSSTPAEDKQ